jgi:hypothetical protein
MMMVMKTATEVTHACSVNTNNDRPVYAEYLLIFSSFVSKFVVLYTKKRFVMDVCVSDT